MRRLGQGDFVIRIREIDKVGLRERFDRFFGKPQAIRRRLAAVQPEVKRDASRSADIIADYLTGRQPTER